MTRNLEDIAPTTDVPGALNVHGGLWSATSLEPGPSGLKSNALPTRLTRPRELLKAPVLVLSKIFNSNFEMEAVVAWSIELWT